MLSEVLVAAATLQSDARDLCLQSQALQAAAQAIRGDALLIKARAQEVRGARRLFGAYEIDTALIVRSSPMRHSASAEHDSECGACLTRTVAHRLG